MEILQFGTRGYKKTFATKEQHKKVIQRTIKQLESLVEDRKSFLWEDSEHDKIFLDDIKALNIAISILKVVIE